MADKPNTKNPFVFRPVILDQNKHEKRRVIRNLPAVHNTETLQKFFGATVDHLFDPGRGKSINGYIGQRPLWHDPDHDYYIEESNGTRSYYQLETSMVSKDDAGSISSLLFYPDLINHLRFQGGLVENHHRLFEQDVYTWCPPVDLDKIINFRQYVWLPVSDIKSHAKKHAIQVMGPLASHVADGETVKFYLPGYDQSGRVSPSADFYDLAVTKKKHITVKVDGTLVSFSYSGSTSANPGKSFVNLNVEPAPGAIVEVWVYSDFENNVLGSDTVDPAMLGGHRLSSGQRIQIVNDKNTDFKPSQVYIVEGVGNSIELVLEKDSNLSLDEEQEPDYMVMARGCENRNQWSTCNRWFHEDVLSDTLDSDYIFAHRASRPILEYTKDLELFNYGLARRADVDVLADAKATGVDNLVALVTANPSSFDLDGVTFAAGANDTVTVGAQTGLPGARILFTNSTDPEYNDRIYAVTNQAGVLSLVMEASGFDPSGLPVYGEVVKIKTGSAAGKDYFWNGTRWLQSQAKLKVNQPPRFALYDMAGVSLADPNTYPRSSFKGSRLFSFQEDLRESGITDPILQIPVVYDNKGDILFENYLGTQRYEYVVSGSIVEIPGFYFHKIGNINPDIERLGNDWFKSTRQSKQFVVDQYQADGSTRLFKISQEPEADVPGQPTNIEVWRGRAGDNGNFARTRLEPDFGYIRTGRDVLITDVQKNDTIEIRTFNQKAPPADMTGQYDVPLNLKANPNNETVSAIGKGDFYNHFSDIITQQEGFSGAEYASNNWRDTKKDPSRGSIIVQHGSPLLKTMLLASDESLDLTKAIRFVEGEYARFKEKFHQKILQYSLSNRFGASATDVEWIFAALSDINLGKTRDFPFHASGVALVGADGSPTFIPASPSFVGVYPLFVPEMVEDTVVEGDNTYSVFFVRGHDGSWTEAKNSDCARILLALEERIWNSVPANIRNLERPAYDYLNEFSDGLRTNQYTYEEYQALLRPGFERWTTTFGYDYQSNDEFIKGDVWTYNWSSIPSFDGSALPGHWRGIYEKYFGTARPDIAPWEMLGFTSRPAWWNNRYGPGPYTLDNNILWDDIEAGYIHSGLRAGTDESLARPGFKQILPVSEFGELLDPYQAGIATGIPLIQDAKSEWKWGDNGPVEQLWRRSVNFGFTVATAAYLMKPAKFVELGWDAENLVKVFGGESREQWLNQLTMNRPKHDAVQVHGEVINGELITRVGIQQWISDLLTSKNSNITTSFGAKIRGLDVQLAYKMGGFTDVSSLVVASDSFGRVPAEDILLNLYRSPSIKEESYSGLAIEWTGNGFRVYGYDTINPYFDVIYGDTSGNSISLGGTGRTDLAPNWKGGIYYAVNLTVRLGDKFYRCVKTHTSLTTFEPEYWVEVARPQYADGTSLQWFLDFQRPELVSRVTYGTVLKSPQDVANLMNGYDRFLKSRGWEFEDLAEDETTTTSWKEALKAFIVWSQREDIEEGDVISLSPGSTGIKYTAAHGTIQPVEQIINGVYAIVDQLGRPVDIADTSVTRYDGEIKVKVSDASAAIYGMRLYVSEIEHVLVFNNRTIFNDVIYDPLLNIRQPRLRVQGFRTVEWQGRIDSPGFIVSDTVLTPNFEKSADDFRRFFDVESMETKNLQERARSNFGFEEREYLNNLLLGPTSQFEFYQGMIQQKGSPTSMRRLLRSNFIRHNKGLRLLEEWAFRVGDYGGSEMAPSLEIGVTQNDFKHNPQLFEFKLTPFGTAEPAPVPGVTSIVDQLEIDGSVSTLDPRWAWRPEEVSVTWAMRDVYVNYSKDLPTAGYVKLDEVRWTCPTASDWNTLVARQNELGAKVANGDRVWYYGIDDFDRSWKTAKYHNTGIELVRTERLRHNNASVVIFANSATVKEVGKGNVTLANSTTNPDNFYLVLEPKFRTEDEVVKPEIVVLEDSLGDGLPLGSNIVPVFKGSASLELTAASTSGNVLDLVPDAGMVISNIKVEVIEPFAEGSTLVIGTDLYPEEFIRTQYNFVEFPELDTTDPVQVVVAPRNLYNVAEDATTVAVDLVRVGLSDPCEEVTSEWFYKRQSDSAFISGGELVFDHTNEEGDYVKTVQVPLTSAADQTVRVKVVTNGNAASSYELTIRAVRPSSGMVDFADVSQPGTVEFSSNSGFVDFPYITSSDRGLIVEAAVGALTSEGKLKITVEYYYTKGFEAHGFYENGEVYPLPVNESNEGGKVFTWIPTRYPAIGSDIIPTGLWSTGDIIEVDRLTELQGGNNGWAVRKFNGNGWDTIRIQNWKIDSDLLTSAAIYDSRENELRMILQLYDPGKGFIPGTADRELHYKLRNDPAVYGSSSDNVASTLWGPEQVGRLWWDLSAVRYLDYEIYDSLEGGVDYRWKNWGRLAPGTNVDVYEWTRSPVRPSEWADYVSKQNPEGNNRNGKPTGIVEDPDTVQYVQRIEWNQVIHREETVYYFWVKNVTSVPAKKERNLSAMQVANIIKNPTANDIPFFAVIDHSRVILGGIKQFVADENSVLKIKWKQSTDNDTPHHKQWLLLREEDERNTIDDSLWNKMRDSLVGWDNNVDELGNPDPKQVPDNNLPRAQQLGNLVRPRQAWFASEPYLDEDARPSRAARATFVECLNSIFAKAPYRNVWFDWRDVFEAGEALPSEEEYDAVALDIADMQLMVSPTVNSIITGERVLIENTVEANGFWTLWECVEESGIRDFKLVDFQKWKMQEGDLWNALDWYADDWSSSDFPVHRFPNNAARDAFRPQEYTLLRGTLVQVNNQQPNDGMWAWYAYTDKGYHEVGRKAGTFKLSSAFFDTNRQRLGPKEVKELLQSDITPDNVLNVLGAAINNRDGSRELQHLIDSIKTQLLDTLQKNKVFFEMVKSAYRANRTVDWAFKTSFLYLGGYSEELRQSPVAFKDQIDNVVAYLEEVKPYHVKIREYVRRLSYGPDIANMAMTDFDKPVYLDQSANPATYRRLEVSKPGDVAFMSTTRPWKDWYDNYQNTNYDQTKWDATWNGVRKLKTQLKFDRVSCAAIRGWDTSPWEAPSLLYTQDGEEVQTLSDLSFKYRNEFLWDHASSTHDTSKPHSDYYFEGPNRFGDCAVNTEDDLNILRREGKVTRDNQGTIVTVRADESRWMWTGRGWVQFDSQGWDQDKISGAAGRVDEFYSPLPGMPHKNLAGLISGCEFEGTNIGGTFNNGVWDMFEWDANGWSSELADRVGEDTLAVDGNTVGEQAEHDIDIQGNDFISPGIDGQHPEEQIFVPGKDALIITVVERDSENPGGLGMPTMRWTKDLTDKWDENRICGPYAQFVEWDQENHTLTIDTADSTFPFHDPENPTAEFIDNVKLSFGYKSKSSLNMSLGTKMFELRNNNGSEIGEIPSGLVGTGIRVVVENAKYPDRRMIGTVVWSNPEGNELATWGGTLQVDIDDYLGDTDYNTNTNFTEWNIIPLENYNQSGLVWVGNARFTYRTVEQNGSQFIMKEAFACPWTLAGIEVANDMNSITVDSEQPVIGGMCFGPSDPEGIPIDVEIG